MRVFAAVIMTAALLGAGPAFADPPQGKGPKHGNQGKHKAKGHDERPSGGVMRFNGLDLNGDRMITRAEWRGTDASFRANDWNRDGVLSGTEVQPDSRRPDSFFRMRA